jgi:signal peptidase I
MKFFLHENSNYRVRVRGRGTSMDPFIKDNELLVVSSINNQRGIKYGDIVVANNENGYFLVHRVIGLKNGRYRLKGDNNYQADGWFSKTAIVGIIEEIYKKSGIRHCMKRWQNAIIAFASLTGFLTFFLSPLFRFVRNQVMFLRKKKI